MDQGSEEEEEKRGMNMKELVKVVKHIEGNAPRSRQSLYSARRNFWSTPKEMGWCERDRDKDRERKRERYRRTMRQNKNTQRKTIGIAMETREMTP